MLEAGPSLRGGLYITPYDTSEQEAWGLWARDDREWTFTALEGLILFIAGYLPSPTAH